jgi:hypothetical protein
MPKKPVIEIDPGTDTWHSYLFVRDNGGYRPEYHERILVFDKLTRQ